MDILTNKNILLGITGSIAAYKAADIASRLKKESCNIRSNKWGYWFSCVRSF